ncbi:GtrA-like protein [Clostridium homopropionicum DSM 5847]|uniref:GtrA-like protein n=1 Tax=Clostridium homopropionicum DSM 5847 TaxID=1121318 RepID=A0A0L6ZCK2_9CLOT|nr:GtrA family protein [Clostridium homopropionicum]KOA20690.1 GtrA-like protein [Clostridium homopropionicum DSM 5847]SFF91394.1 Putative flippase GtrA (transmembrane translocase of bactoprenol-linked glucose) [Clostridium homopropionicum]
MKIFIKFCLVGGTNTLLTLATFYILNTVLGINYILSSILGYCVGMVNSYILNKRWTFYDSEKIIFNQFIKFVTVNLMSLSINLLVMYTLSGKLHLNAMIAQIVATGFSIISNYIGSKLWVFRKLELR